MAFDIEMIRAVYRDLPAKIKKAPPLVKKVALFCKASLVLKLYPVIEDR